MSFLNTIFGKSRESTAESAKTALDMVTYAADLASNPTAIDPLLDNVRTITANLSTGQTPSARDNQTLLGTYLQIEQYLITKEPLRAFTKEGLRAKLGAALREQLETYEKIKN